MLYDKRWELDPISRTLLTAADIMEELGWCGDAAHGPNKEICMVVAVTRAFPGIRTPKDDRVRWAAHDRLCAYLGIHSGRLVYWNENICRSKEQAVAALRGAAFAKGKS